MLKCVIVGCAYYGYDVKLHFVWNVKGCYVCVGRSHHVQNLFIVNGFNWVAVEVGASFDFYKHDAIPFHRNNVEFVVSYAKIALAYCIAISN